jgi:hypothetical protein
LGVVLNPDWQLGFLRPIDLELMLRVVLMARAGEPSMTAEEIEERENIVD